MNARLEAAPRVTVPVYRPKLPSAAQIVPYLRELDRTRRYTSQGKLVQQLESRLSALLGGPALSASSGTAAIIGAILAKAGRATPDKPYCICPAYTFVATASAIEQCGYKPLLVDIDASEWMLDVALVKSHVRLHEVGLVVAVAPYGRAPSQAAWLHFQEQTGIPVVIDAAASFEAVADNPQKSLGPIPITLSFNATKAFATGEGGAIVCTDPELIISGARALNFGFLGQRLSVGPSTNGKMSEYHAAVGLAELDGWNQKRAAFRTVAGAYRREAERLGVAGEVITAPDISSCYALFLANDSDQALSATNALGAIGVEHRYWYGRGLHREPNYQTAERSILNRTEHLAPRLIGLPVAPDLPQSVVRRIVSLLARVRAGALSKGSE